MTSESLTRECFFYDALRYQAIMRHELLWVFLFVPFDNTNTNAALCLKSQKFLFLHSFQTDDGDRKRCVFVPRFVVKKNHLCFFFFFSFAFFHPEDLPSHLRLPIKTLKLQHQFHQVFYGVSLVKTQSSSFSICEDEKKRLKNGK